MPTPKKEETVGVLRDELEKSEGVVVIQFEGLSVPLITQLRSRLRENDARMTVVKNRLTKIAFAGTPAEGLSEALTGPKALTFSYGDVPPVAKVLSEFAKEHGGISLEASYMDGNVYAKSQTEALASIPSKPELLSSVVGALNSPLSGLVFTLKGIISDVVYTLQAVADQKAEQPAA